MKLKTYLRTIIILSLLVTLNSCSSDDNLTGSRLDTNEPVKTALDTWIETSYVNPYNIAVLYKWNENLVDNDLFLSPPDINKVQPALEIIQKIWIDTYSEVGGSDFIKKIAPREFVLVGGVNLNTTETITLGEAVAGQRIILYQTDLVDKKDRENVQLFVSTIQHEYIHILNQTKPFDEQAFGKITPSGYTTNWYATSIATAREQGFITDYARSRVIEDFAEMAQVMLTYSKVEYQAILDSIQSEVAKKAIKDKEALVVKYFKEAFDIDFYELRDAAERNTEIVIKG